MSVSIEKNWAFAQLEAAPLRPSVHGVEKYCTCMLPEFNQQYFPAASLCPITATCQDDAGAVVVQILWE